MSAPKATSSIGRKILVRSMIVAIVPLLILGLASYFGVRSMKNNVSREVQNSSDLLADETIAVTSQGQANSVSKELNLVVAERIQDVLAWSRSVEIVDGARLAGAFSKRTGLNEQDAEVLETRYGFTLSTGQSFKAETYLAAELWASAYFEEISITDKYGFNAALTSSTGDFIQSDEDWWKEAFETGLSIGEVELDESSGAYSVVIAARIQDAAGGTEDGVIRAVLNVSFVKDIATANATEQVDYVVSLEDGRLLADTASDHDVDRIMNAELAATEVSPGLVNGLESDASAAQANSQAVWGHTRTVDPVTFENIQGFDGFNWVVVSTQSPDTAFAPIKGLEDLDDDVNSFSNTLLLIILGVALLAGLIAFFSAQFLASSIVDPIRRLTTAASDAATKGLPSAVAEINTEGADVDSIRAPQVDINTNDELEELAGSFNEVQGSAVRLAAEQAVSRRNTSEMFVNLGRRNQSLLKRQLRFIDGLEKSETDPDTLESLFKLDHLATRMRRNAESLLVIAGDRSPRRWAAPVPIDQTVQAALAEVEDYERVNMSGVKKGHVQGNVVADVAHLLAELIENALNFSPPQSDVEVSGEKSAEGYVITVSDSGLGMPQEKIDEANERLQDAQGLSEIPSQYLGLFVVGQLAQRHGLNVRLAGSSSGSGLQSILTLPSSLTEDAKASTEDNDKSLVTAAPVQTIDIEVVEDGTETSTAAASDAAGAKAPTVGKTPHKSKKTKASSGSKPEVAIKKVDEPTVETRPASEPSTEFGRRSDDEEQSAVIEGKEIPRRKSNRKGEKKDNPSSNGSKPGSSKPNGAKPNGSKPSGANKTAVGASGVAATTAIAGKVDEVSELGTNVDAEEITDPAIANAVAELGFTRRTKKKSSGPKVSPPKREKVAEESSGDVMEDAEKSRNRWSQFQRGKQDAEGEAEES